MQTQLALPATIFEAAQRAGVFKTFLAAIDSADLAGYLGDAGPITVFAPTDAAFAHFPTRTWSSFVDNQRSLLRNVLTCHFTNELVTAAQFTDGQNATVKTVQGATFIVEGEERPRIGGAYITHRDMPAGNGMLHGIDSVLWFAASVRPTRDRDNKRPQQRWR